jgi:hypothetical protein
MADDDDDDGKEKVIPAPPSHKCLGLHWARSDKNSHLESPRESPNVAVLLSKKGSLAMVFNNSSGSVMVFKFSTFAAECLLPTLQYISLNGNNQRSGLSA